MNGIFSLVHKMEFKKISKKEKGLSFLVVGILMVVGLSTFVSAFALGFANKISLYPGESTDTSFSLQNVIEPTADLVLGVVVEEGSEYVSFTEGTQFNVPEGESVRAKVRVSVPETASVGDIYTVTVVFGTVSSESIGDEGTIQFTTFHRKSFEIEVMAEPALEIEEPAAGEGLGAGMWILIIVIIVVVIVVIVLVVKKKKNASIGVKPTEKPVK